MTFPGRCIWHDLAPDAAHRREQQKVADQRESLLTAEDIDRALEQGRAGVEYMRKNWGSMWRLPRYPMRLR